MRWRLRGPIAAARSAAAGDDPVGRAGPAELGELGELGASGDLAESGESGAEADARLAAWRRASPIELTIAPQPVLVGGSLLRAPDVSGTRSLIQRFGERTPAGAEWPGAGRAGGIVVPQPEPEVAASEAETSRRDRDRAARGSRRSGRRARDRADDDRSRAGQLPAALAPVKRRAAGQSSTGERLSLVSATGEFVGDPRAEETPYSSSAWLRMVQAYRQLPDEGADAATQVLPGLTQSVNEDGSAVLSWKRPTARATSAESPDAPKRKATLAESRRLGIGRPLSRRDHPGQLPGEADDGFDGGPESALDGAPDGIADSAPDGARAESEAALAAGMPLAGMVPGTPSARALRAAGQSASAQAQAQSAQAHSGPAQSEQARSQSESAQSQSGQARSHSEQARSQSEQARSQSEQARAATFAVARRSRQVPPGLGLGAPITLRGVPGSPGDSSRPPGSGARPAGRGGTGAGPDSPRRSQDSPHDPFNALGLYQAAGSVSSAPQRPVARTTGSASGDEVSLVPGPSAAHHGPGAEFGPVVPPEPDEAGRRPVVVTPIYRVAAELPHVRVTPQAFESAVEPLVHREPAAPEPAAEAAAGYPTTAPPVVPGQPADYVTPPASVPPGAAPSALESAAGLPFPMPPPGGVSSEVLTPPPHPLASRGPGGPRRSGAPTSHPWPGEPDEFSAGADDAQAGQQPAAGAQDVSAIPYDLADMMRRLHGVDVSDVVVSRGAQAGLEAQAMGARAFARDGEIVLPPGAGPFERPQARALLAHELTHVAQQRLLGPTLPPEDSAAGAALERAAVQAQRRVLGQDEPDRGAWSTVAAPLLVHAPPQQSSQAPPPAPVAASAGVQRQGEDLAELPWAGNAFDPLALLPQQIGEPGLDLALEIQAIRAALAGLPATDTDSELVLARDRLLARAGQRLLNLDDSLAVSELADGIYRRIRARLQRELLVDRERSGLLSDFR